MALILLALTIVTYSSKSMVGTNRISEVVSGLDLTMASLLT